MPAAAPAPAAPTTAPVPVVPAAAPGPTAPTTAFRCATVEDVPDEDTPSIPLQHQTAAPSAGQAGSRRHPATTPTPGAAADAPPAPACVNDMAPDNSRTPPRRSNAAGQPYAPDTTERRFWSVPGSASSARSRGTPRAGRHSPLHGTKKRVGTRASQARDVKTFFEEAPGHKTCILCK